MSEGSSSKKRSRRKRKRERKPNPATQLTDDLLVDILSRVPYRSLCRFRCVSTHWRTVISDPCYRRRLPQTLAGFFHQSPIAGGSSESMPVRYCFTNVSGTGRPLIDPSFPFLPDHEREHLDLMDSSNVELYLVLNPATEKWVAVPVSWRWAAKAETVRLGFDPAFSPHFYIFEFQLDENDEDDYADGHVLGVKIYSSETRIWCHKQSDWKTDRKFEIALQDNFKSVFVNGVLYVGVLYVIAYQQVIGAVDVKGETWRIIDFPHCKDDLPFHYNGPVFIDLSQGRLHLATADERKLAIWVLEDNDTDEWILKYTIYYAHLVGRDYVQHFRFHEFIVVAIHPHHELAMDRSAWRLAINVPEP